MAQAQLEVVVLLTPVNCGECGGTYGLNARYHQQARDKCTSWTCPYCKTGWGYSQQTTEAQKLQEQLKEEKRVHQRTLARANELEAAAKLAAQRAKHGVCPCCNRTFKQLAAHMKNRHPEFPK